MNATLSNQAREKRPPRLLFLGMEGAFAPPPLQQLLQEGFEVAALVIPAPASFRTEGAAAPPLRRRELPGSSRSSLPVLTAQGSPSLLSLAQRHGIPVWEVARLRAPETLATLAAYRPDLICVACFPWRLPVSLLTLPPLGCLNLHPSLLPANRGPQPLFWTFREGQRETGVTVHLMEERFDAGDILEQEAIAVPDGISYAELEQLCAARGALLLARAVHALCNGSAQRRPQDERRSSYHPAPGPEDLIVPAATWEARHVYNFICGIAPWAGPLPVITADAQLLVTAALACYQPGDLLPAGPLPLNECLIPCKEGLVHVRLAAPAAHSSPQ
jgi:methionyl-tRNA formyltransferase